jgi:hypothetical protein
MPTAASPARASTSSRFPGCRSSRRAGFWRAPRQRAYLVFWVAEADGVLRYALKMAPTGQPDSVVVTFERGVAQRLRIPRRPLPRGTGTVLFYRRRGARSEMIPVRDPGDGTRRERVCGDADQWLLSLGLGGDGFGGRGR